MADLPVGSEGSLAGTTNTTILAAPAAATQRVIPKGGVAVYNADTAERIITFSKNKGGTRRVLQKMTLQAEELAILSKIVILDATDESLEAKTDATAATTEPTFDVAAMETT